MKFKNDEVVNCEGCNREISQWDDEGYEDHPLCSGCWAREYQEHTKKECSLCKKQLGTQDYSYNIDENEELAHTDCVNNLSEIEQDNWSDDFDY